VVSGRKQRILLWWSWIAISITGFATIVLIRVFPPPSSTWSAERLAEWYQDHTLSIRIGAMLLGWMSGFVIQFAVVLYIQARRVEPGAKVWSALVLVSGALTSVFIAFPALCFGTAAYSPFRSPDATQVMHELGVMALVTTDQMYIGAWVAIAVLCFTTTDSPSNPFKRWFGWFTVWVIIVFEPGALGFLPKTGLFAINGIVTFWIPAVAFAVWMAPATWLIVRALRVQDQEELTELAAQSATGADNALSQRAAAGPSGV
jgi:hypothetical protein